MMTATNIGNLIALGGKLDVILASLQSNKDAVKAESGAVSQMVALEIAANVDRNANKVSWQTAMNAIKSGLKEVKPATLSPYLSKIRAVNETVGEVEIRKDGEVVDVVDVWAAYASGDYVVTLPVAYASVKYDADKIEKNFRAAVRAMLREGFSLEQMEQIAVDEAKEVAEAASK